MLCRRCFQELSEVEQDSVILYHFEIHKRTLDLVDQNALHITRGTAQVVATDSDSYRKKGRSSHRDHILLLHVRRRFKQV